MHAGNDWHLTQRVHAGSGRGDPFAAAVRATRMAMIITDPRQHDNPIVFANDAFLRLTGYSRADVMGRNCRFLQGSDTNRDDVAKIRQSVVDQIDINIDILNYKKDGSAFYNALHISPVHSESGELLFFFSSQLDVSERYVALRQKVDTNAALAAALEAKTLLVREIDHRVKNNLQMVSSMIRLQSRTLPDPVLRRSFMATVERIEALSTVHRRLYESDTVQEIDLEDLIDDLATDLLGATGRNDITLTLHTVPLKIQADKAAGLALLLNETITNALKHAFPDGRNGRLSISNRLEGEHVVLTIEDDGIGMKTEMAERASFGSELIETLSRQLDAQRSVSAGTPSGTHIEYRFSTQGLLAA